MTALPRALVAMEEALTCRFCRYVPLRPRRTDGPGRRGGVLVSHRDVVRRLAAGVEARTVAGAAAQAEVEAGVARIT